VRKGVIILLLVTVAIMLVMAAPAFAKTGTKAGGYWPYSADFEGTGEWAFYGDVRYIQPPATTAAEHSLEMAGDATPPGSPHAGLPTSTGKCKVCHAVHGAGIATNLNATTNDVVTEKLLRSTAADACVFCHVAFGSFAPDPYNTPILLADGITLSTSLQNYNSNENNAAYPFGDARYARSGHNASHGHDNPQTVPAGGSKSYRGCVSCHSVHGANTIAGSENILKNDPAKGTTSQAATGWGAGGAGQDPNRGYGSHEGPVTTQAEFCEDCHDGTKLDPIVGANIPIVTQASFNTAFPSCGASDATSGSWFGVTCHNSVQGGITESIAQFGAFNNPMHNGRSHIMTTVRDAVAQDGSSIAGGPSGVPVDGVTAPTNGCTLCHDVNQDINNLAGGATFPHFGGNSNELIRNFPNILRPDQVCRRCHSGVGTTF
jgi:hypothetical protein